MYRVFFFLLAQYCTSEHYRLSVTKNVTSTFFPCSYALSRTPRPEGVRCQGRPPLQGLRQLFVVPCIPRTTFRHYFRVQEILFFRYTACVWVLLVGLWGGCDSKTTKGKPRTECQRCCIPVGLQTVPISDTPLLLVIIFVPWPTS